MMTRKPQSAWITSCGFKPMIVVLLFLSIITVYVWKRQWRSGVVHLSTNGKGDFPTMKADIHFPSSEFSQKRTDLSKDSKQKTETAVNTTNSLEDTKTIMALSGWQILDTVYLNDLKNFEELSRTRCAHKCRIVLQYATESHENADLVIFDLRNLPSKPPTKFEGQLWLFRTMEAPFNIRFDLSRYNGLINYTFTLHPHSTIVDMYGFAMKRPRPLPEQNYALTKHEVMMGTSRKLNAMWQVSNCDFVHSGRIEYVNELANYMTVDVETRNPVGCGSKLKRVRLNPRKGDCDLCDYTFYLSFENALCKDYITEKLWKVLDSEKLAIPIALGGYAIEEYTRVAPPNSFIHVRNFTSPSELVKHLDYVTKNDDAFNYYHRWRQNFAINQQFNIEPYCKICGLAHARPHQVIERLDDFYTTKDCR